MALKRNYEAYDKCFTKHYMKCFDSLYILSSIIVNFDVIFLALIVLADTGNYLLLTLNGMQLF